MKSLDFIQEAVTQTVGDQQVKSIQSVSGGCINSSFHIQTESNSYFIKCNDAAKFDMFEKEVLGLQLLSKSESLKTPSIHGSGTIDDQAYLILEWIDSSEESSIFWRNFGRQLAIQHRQSSKQFGSDHDNYIGSLPQSNKYHDNWIDFFIQERINPQLKLALESKRIELRLLNQFDILFKKLPELVPEEPQALLHGDLWNGNFICSNNHIPVEFDPAVYYGHRETELAFTTLFGGFDPLFYSSYQEEFPLERNFKSRIEIHNLYPLLVHVNLFGSSYLSGINETLKRFI